MTDWKIRGICKGCNKPRWFVRKRKLRIPTGAIATSQALICSKCFRKLMDKLP